MKLFVLILIVGLMITLTGCQPDAEAQFRLFLEDHVSRIEPMMKDYALAYWEATSTGEDQYYEKFSNLEIEIRKIYSSSEEFEKIKNWKNEGRIKDPLLKRQLDLLYNAYLENQIDPKKMEETVKLAGAIEKKFNTFRPSFEGKRVDDNALRDILIDETRTKRRKAAWEAFKEVGEEVADDLKELVRLRNSTARDLGYENYYIMRMKLQEHDPDQVFGIFDELKNLTDEPFKVMKEELDGVLAKKYSIRPENLKPWHYQDFFFQEAPDLGSVDVDPYIEKKDLVKVTADYYSGIGLPVEDILSRSDLYGREGKYQHAYCMGVDRKEDVRIMCSVEPTHYWLGTLLHELGHGVYSRYQDENLPFLLREEAHIFTTEAIAMFFGRLANNPDWLQATFEVPEPIIEKWRPVLHQQNRMGQLIFSRWAQVMLRFERELYSNPDQDLNTLWWKLKKECQFLNPPEDRNAPDWASKIHFTSSPVYYHNYMLGELLASQLVNSLKNEFDGSPSVDNGTFIGNKDMGTFMKERIFKPGKTLTWPEFVEQATGETLSAKYFANQFVKP